MRRIVSRGVRCRFLEGLKVTADQGHVGGRIEGNRFPGKAGLTWGLHATRCNVTWASLCVWCRWSWFESMSNLRSLNPVSFKLYTNHISSQMPMTSKHYTKGGLCNVWKSLALWGTSGLVCDWKWQTSSCILSVQSLKITVLRSHQLEGIVMNGCLVLVIGESCVSIVQHEFCIN